MNAQRTCYLLKNVHSFGAIILGLYTESVGLEQTIFVGVKKRVVWQTIAVQIIKLYCVKL